MGPLKAGVDVPDSVSLYKNAPKNVGGTTGTAALNITKIEKNGSKENSATPGSATPDALSAFSPRETARLLLTASPAQQQAPSSSSSSSSSSSTFIDKNLISDS